jgi:UrcA family protein
LIFDRFVDRFPFSALIFRQTQAFIRREALVDLTPDKDPSGARDAAVQSGKSSMKTMIASFAALLLLSGAGVAAASGSTEAVQIAVPRGHLDMSNPRDAKIMMKRIDTAALEACGAYPQSALGVKRAIAGSSCHRDAVAGAVAQLSSSQASLTVTGVRSR